MQDLQTVKEKTVVVNEGLLAKLSYEQLRMITTYINVRGQQAEARRQLPEYKSATAQAEITMEMAKLQDALMIVTQEMHNRAEGFYKMIFGG